MEIKNGILYRVYNSDIVNEKFVIPDSVTEIGYEAFLYCTKLRSVIVSNSVIIIRDKSFYGCIDLESIVIPDSVDEIGYSCFNNCTNLESINVNEGNKYYSSEDGVLLNKNKTRLIKYPEGKKDEKYIIPDSVNVIIDYAFYYSDKLTSITIPNSVHTIGQEVFRNCNNLESIVIPYSVTKISSCTFENCENLTSVFIPDSITKIGGYAFSNCKKLKSINIPNSVTEIGYYIFANCTNLTSITIPNSVNKIGYSAFYNCNNLSSISISNSITIIGYNTFYNCKNLQSKKGNYKAFEKELICNNMQYIQNEWNTVEGDIKICNWGLHYVTNLFDIFNYYFGNLENNIEIWEVEVGDIIVDSKYDSKKSTNSIKPIKRLNKQEIISILNNK